MPEGDTIFRTAAALDRALAGKVLVGFEAPRLRWAPFPDGTVVEGADAVGKHCLIRFSDGRVLRTHMRMGGSWHLARPDERWRRPRHAMRALVAVEDWVAVCFSAPVVELTTSAEAAVALGHLGPDLSRPDPDLDLAVATMARVGPPNEAIKTVLLDQRVAAGIGNVYASEVCFALGLDPRTPLSAVDPDLRRALLSRAGEQLRANLARVDRATYEGGLAVYGRLGRPCRRCGTPIEVTRLGADRRVTYWCPRCQPEWRRQRVIGQVDAPDGR